MADSEQEEGKDKPHIAWHAALFDAVRMELVEDFDKLQFQSEHRLVVEPLKADVLIIKKAPDAVLHQKFAQIFRGHNILEYKSPDDGLSIADYIGAFCYPCVYLKESTDAKKGKESADKEIDTEAKKKEVIQYTDITLTLIRDSYPRELLKHLSEDFKRTITQSSPGIYRVEGELFPVQIIVGSQLPSEENIWLTNLNRKDLDTATFEKMLQLNKDAEHNINMGAYFEALFDAKKGLLQEVSDMHPSNLAEVIEEMGLSQKWRAEGRKEGIDEGRSEGREEGRKEIIYVLKRLKDNASPETIADEMDLPIDEVKKYIHVINS